jgi:hypothetical protein
MEDALMDAYIARSREFESRVNLLTEEYDTLLEHVPQELSECCLLVPEPEPEEIKISLEFSAACSLPPIVEQRIRETFNELFPQGRFSLS